MSSAKLNIGDKVVFNHEVDYPAIKIHTIERVGDGKFYISEHAFGLSEDELIKIPDDCDGEYYTSKCESILWGRLILIGLTLFAIVYFLTTKTDFIKSFFQAEKHGVITSVVSSIPSYGVLFFLLAINIIALFFLENAEKGKGLKNIFIVLFNPIFLLILSAVVVMIWVAR